jgi:MFS transporter, DHA1 family, multidrug resistance protein
LKTELNLGCELVLAEAIILSPSYEVERHITIKPHIQGTTSGQLVRLISGNKIFQYPDEVDPSLWKKAIQQETAQPSQQIVQHNSGPADKAGQYHLTQEQQTGGAFGGSDVLVITWYGQDDPEVRSLPSLPSNANPVFYPKNPQNWPNSCLKHLVAFQMCILNFAVYIASSI